ncbi:hypothetical protein M9Y10_011366 [Tritrichomonas musculus]|uniref:Centrosomal protein CEP104 N-terminal domain-containing protein n=1 Tax=Tritrichomonas musculus TaxID=1915356 RepID=A0ABR2IJA5_9EUKA
MRKTSFNCIYCSSEDIDYPFNNLFDSNSKSWTSRSNPKYPIKAVVDLRGTFVFDGIHIVSHESMIPTRIDLYISNNPNLNGMEINVDNFFEYKSKFNWENIGFFCFSSNERSNWVAREFKKVMLPQVQASFMMFVISECYKSIPGNPYKRVSIISLIFLGTHLYRPRFGSSLVEMYEDLTNAKKEAIQNENFAQADIINIQIENTKRNRDILNELFQKKQIALKNEEFLVVDSIITNIFSILNQPIQLQQQMQPEQQQQQLVHDHTGQNENAIKSPKTSKVFDENNSQDKKKSEGNSRNIKKDDKKKEEEEEDEKDADEDKETEEDEQDEDKEDGKDKEDDDKEEEEENGDEKNNEEKDNVIEEEEDDDDNDDDKKVHKKIY